MTTPPITLHGIRTGVKDSAPVVLLHSAGLDLTYWESQIAALRTDYDVAAFDLPGHGKSVGLAEDMTIDRIVDAVIHSIDALDAGPVHLIGLSLGGMIAQAVAVEHPTQVQSLALIDTAARFGTDGQKKMRRRAHIARQHGMPAILDDLIGHWFQADTIHDRPDLIDRATKTLLHDDIGAHAALWEMIADFDLHARLPSIRVPTLVLVGEHDSSSPVTSAEELQALIPGAVLHIIEDAAHLSPLERPDVVNRHLTTFLSKFALQDSSVR